MGADVIEDLMDNTPEDLISFYKIKARVTSKVHNSPNPSGTGPKGDMRGNDGLDLALNLSAAENIDDIDGPPCIYIVAKNGNPTCKSFIRNSVRL